MALEMVTGREFRLVGDVVFDNVMSLEQAGLSLFEEYFCKVMSSVKTSKNSETVGWSGEEWHLCLAKVNHADSSALALLISWQRWALSRGVRMSYLNVPHHLDALIQVCDASSLVKFTEKNNI